MQLFIIRVLDRQTKQGESKRRVQVQQTKLFVCIITTKKVYLPNESCTKQRFVVINGRRRTNEQIGRKQRLKVVNGGKRHIYRLKRQRISHPTFLKATH